MIAGRPRAASDTVRQVTFVVIVALIISLALRTFILQIYTVPSASMEPSLRVQDRIVVSPTTGQAAPMRGDVVVFMDPGGWLPPATAASTNPLARAMTGVLRFVGLVAPERRTLVKRVIGLGGDRVVCCDQNGRVTVNGTPLLEPYVAPGAAPSLTAFDVTVPAGSLWVMGDNRPVSMDSRAQLALLGNGFVPLTLVRGTVKAVAWPPPNAHRLPDVRTVFAAVPPTGPAAVPPLVQAAAPAQPPTAAR